MNLEEPDLRLLFCLVTRILWVLLVLKLLPVFQMNIIAGGFYDGLMVYAHALNETAPVPGARPPGKLISGKMWNRTFHGQCTDRTVLTQIPTEVGRAAVVQRLQQVGRYRGALTFPRGSSSAWHGSPWECLRDRRVSKGGGGV